MASLDLLHFIKSTDGVIKIVGFLLLLGISMIEFLPLLEEYRFNNIATHVKIIGQNETVKPPPVGLRIPWQKSKVDDLAIHLLKNWRNQTSECVRCERMAKHSWDIWEDLDPSAFNGTEDIKRALSVEILTRFLNNTNDDFEVLNPTYADWNAVLVEVVWDFFDCLRSVDAFGDLYTQIDRKNMTRHWCLSSDLADFALSNKTKIDLLFQKIVDIICIVMKIQDSNENFEKKFCVETLVRSPSILFARGFQFAPPMSDGRANILVTSNGKYGVQEALSDPYRGFYLFSDIDFMSWPPSDVEFNHLLHATKEIGDVVVGYQVSATVVEKRDGISCYQESSPVMCISNCVLSKIGHICKCIPYTFRNHDPLIGLHLPYCTTYQYINCDFNSKKSKQECSDECNYPCEHVSYTWHTVQIATKRQWREYNLTLHPITAKYIQFAVTTKDSRAQFVAQVGNVLNLYLGFSGLTIIGIILVCREMIKQRKASRMASRVASTQKAKGTENGQRVGGGLENSELHETKAVRPSDLSMEDVRSSLAIITAKLAQLEEETKVLTMRF